MDYLNPNRLSISGKLVKFQITPTLCLRLPPPHTIQCPLEEGAETHLKSALSYPLSLVLGTL